MITSIFKYFDYYGTIMIKIQLYCIHSLVKYIYWGSGPLLCMACTSPISFNWFLCTITEKIGVPTIVCISMDRNTSVIRKLGREWKLFIFHDNINHTNNICNSGIFEYKCRDEPLTFVNLATPRRLKQLAGYYLEPTVSLCLCLLQDTPGG